MSPIIERQPESLDFKSLTEELPHYQAGQGDTPSPRTPSTNGSPSPPPIRVAAEPTTALVPITAEDGIPYDHTLPQYLRQVTGEPSLEDIYNVTLRILTETSSLQQMSVYTPNLRELNLEGSAITSLRDIGSELRFLQVLRIGSCRLVRLDGTLGLTSLRELYAPGNFITSAAPCAHLSKLRVLDLSRNCIREMRTLSFLSSCRHLSHISLEGNDISTNPELPEFLQATIPNLQSVDGTLIRAEDSERAADSSSDSRISSASSHSSAQNHPSTSTTDTPAPRSSSPLRKPENTTSDAIEASRQWRTAYYKFRESNSLQWLQDDETKPEESLKNGSSDEDD